MDLIIYCVVLALIGFLRVGQTSNISNDESIVETGATVSVDYDIPVGQNLAMLKESGAYTLILEELGLI